MADHTPDLDLNKYADEALLLARLTVQAGLSAQDRQAIVARAADLVRRIREQGRTGLTESFLLEYGLSTEEGLALMRLAEALLRVPDLDTVEALIEDKIAPGDWGSHAGHSPSALVNAATFGLSVTRSILEPRDAGLMSGLVKRVSEPVIRKAVVQAMREMGRQFVLGQTISGALRRAARQEARGYTYSYDMLGEQAMTGADAARYGAAYRDAIAAIGAVCRAPDIAANPGISIKLSALHPRYELAKRARVLAELVPVVRDLARRAARAGMGLNIDAEEADRLTLSIEVIEAVLSDPELAGWDGFGVVVQAYGRRAGDLIGHLYDLATRLDRKIMVRLVKGAYWDGEIKQAQVEGAPDFPVFTRKAGSDVSYIANARRLMGMVDRIYPQFATHNAHTVAAILHMADQIGLAPDRYEFQRLHGMGEALHDALRHEAGTRCRIYAPVGAHRDLLAYLVRRLLENGANSSFVNQIADADIPAETVAACPFAALDQPAGPDEPVAVPPRDLFAPERVNARGFDLSYRADLDLIERTRTRPSPWQVGPLLAGGVSAGGPASGEVAQAAFDPATGAQIGTVVPATARDVEQALAAARPWAAPASERAEVLRRAATLYERDFASLFALLATEAGKTPPDAVAELREAVDFLRYYAGRGAALNAPARGVFTCISPWNFPLAIFTGQIAAALAAGNGVLAKPAETTPAIAAWGVRRLYEAGVPASALQLLPGEGGSIGAALVSDARVDGVAFTGSTATARRIQAAMADHLAPGAPLIAETGGLNAMIVDSTALPEQAVRDIVASAFQSAGQRCSALRCLYVQDDIAAHVQQMIIGAMDQLELGEPWAFSTDIGPVITAQAKADIDAHIAGAAQQGRLLHQLNVPGAGHFVAPALIKVGSIADLGREVFGPVLHLATFRAGEIDKVIAQINATGYGLTFGLHSRIDTRVDHVAGAIHAGNIYVNRNQIGAIVGSQPFGGEGLSGTGPKAGGPHYLDRFVARPVVAAQGDAPDLSGAGDLAGALARAAQTGAAQARGAPTLLPGPTGEHNALSILPRAPVLCLGPGADLAQEQLAQVRALGGVGLAVDRGVAPDLIETLDGFGALIWWGDEPTARAYAQALARRDGAIVALITGRPDPAHVLLERHLCVDTTAAGGNAGLLAGGA